MCLSPPLRATTLSTVRQSKCAELERSSLALPPSPRKSEKEEEEAEPFCLSMILKMERSSSSNKSMWAELHLNFVIFPARSTKRFFGMEKRGEDTEFSRETLLVKESLLFFIMEAGEEDEEEVIDSFARGDTPLLEEAFGVSSSDSWRSVKETLTPESSTSKSLVESVRRADTGMALKDGAGVESESWESDRM